MAYLNHIGIAVADPARIKKLFSLLNLHTEREEKVPDQKVMTHFLPLPLEQGYLELLEPSEEDGPISKFLQKRGPGIHHLSFSVKRGELNSLCQKLRSEGFQLLYEEPRLGAHGMRINFIHPSTAGGILIEVMEPN